MKDREILLHNPQPCLRAETEAALYVAGDMTERAAGEYARHLEVCPACAAAVAEEREVAAWMRALPAERPTAATLSALSAAAVRFAGELQARRLQTIRQPWHVRVRRWIEAERAWWEPALGWTFGVLILLASAQVLRDTSLTTANPEVAEVAVASTQAWDYELEALGEWGSEVRYRSDSPSEREWSDTRDEALSAQLATLRDNIRTLSLAMASDSP